MFLLGCRLISYLSKFSRQVRRAPDLRTAPQLSYEPPAPHTHVPPFKVQNTSMAESLFGYTRNHLPEEYVLDQRHQLVSLAP